MKKNKLYTANKWNQPAFMPHRFNLGSQMQRPFPSGVGSPTWNPYYNSLKSAGIGSDNSNTTTTPFYSSDFTSNSNDIGTPLSNDNYWNEAGFIHAPSWNSYSNPLSGLSSDSKLLNVGNNGIVPSGDSYLNSSFESIKGKGLDASILPKPNDSNHSWLGISKEDNPFSKQNIGNTAKAGIGALMNTGTADKLLDDLDPVYKLAGGRESAIGNGLSDAGKGLFKAGASTGNGWLMLAGAGAKVLGGLTNAAFGVKLNKENINSVTNNINSMKESSNKFMNVTSNEGLANAWNNYSGGYDFSNGFIGKNGWFNHKATKKANQLRKAQNNAQDVAMHSLMEATNQVDAANDARVMRNFAAFGGPLNINDNMGAIDYGFMSDYLNMKNKQVGTKNSILNTYIGNYPSFAYGGGIHIDKNKEGTFTAAATKHHMGVQEFANYVLSHKDSFSPEMKKKANFARNAAHWHGYGGLLDNNDTLFALGGDMQSNGADWSDGLSHVDAGGTHEENPNEGVPMGIAPDGQPNLVEEGETIWNDYVFSNRIQPDKDTLKAFHIGKNSKMTYADLSKKLEDEAKERPNDPISQAALEANMSKLADAQERQKQEEESNKAMEAFESLSPEQQEALLAQVQQATAKQQPTEQGGEEQPQEQHEDYQEESQYSEESPQEQEMQEQPVESSPEEQQALQDQAMQQQAIQEQQEAVEAAYGGSLHKFDNGGWKQKLSKAMKLYTAGQWNDWAVKKGIKDFDWNSYTDLATLLKNEAFKSALAKDNAALADAMARNYDFGNYKYDASKVKAITNIHNGNWKTANIGNGFQGWLDYDNETPDPMVDEAIGNYMKANNISDRNKAINAIKGISREDLQKLFAETNAYKKSTEALHNEDNSLLYLNTILNDPNSPKEAKAWANNFVRNGKWIEGKNHSYDSVYGSKGKNVRNTYPGTYWHSFLPAVRGNITTSLMWNPKTNNYEVMEAIPEGLKPESSYSWQDEKNDNTLNYYRIPETKAAATNNKDKGNSDERMLDYKNDKLRYTGLLGPVVGLGMQMAGVGKSDYSGLDSAMEYASTNGGGYADYKPIGNYLTYNPTDIWAEQAKMDANSRATDRAIANSSLPTSNKYAGLLANSYNNQLADGELYRKALEYNDAKKQQVAAFNQKTDLANAEAYNRAALTNAEMEDRDAQFRANLAANIAGQKMAADAAWNQGIYGNVNNIFKGISDLGRENAQYNMIAGMANAGVFDKLPKEDILTAMTGARPTRAAKGGKLNKKKRKGLTF